jgi:adenine deaminase
MNVRDLTERSKNLVDVAMGRSPADIVIKNGRWVNVQSGEILPNSDIAIAGERIAYVGDDASHTIGEKTRVIDAENRYLVPGLLDGHMHVESGMLTVTEFVRAVIPHGTTAMFIDPHEIANVFGLKGVRLMVDEAVNQPIHIWVQMPSCVPSAPGLETPGDSLGPEEVAEAMKWEGIIGLGEMMNFPGVYNSDDKMHAEMAQTIIAGKIVGGHYASPDLGLPFHGYAAGGPQDDHEGTHKEDAVIRVRQGMKAMLRFGSAWHDVAEGVKAITEAGLDPRNFILCTDDSHSKTLVNDGHVNLAVQQAIQNGIPPLTAIQMATINTAEHFGVWRDIGMIAPGRFADILILKDLEDFRPDTVIARGRTLVENRKSGFDLPAFEYPNWALQSIHLGHPLKETDFKLYASGKGQVRANVIGVIENQAPTRHLQKELTPVDGEIRVDMERDINKIALVERHKGTGGVTVGLVTGFGFNVPCAVGSTVAHDSHHMIVVGTSESDMAKAANELARIGGGQVVVRDGEVIGEVNLPIAGLMSSEKADVVAKKAQTVLDGFITCGCSMNNPNMQLSLLALVVIPELRISDLGLVDVTKFDFLPVIED